MTTVLEESAEAMTKRSIRKGSARAIAAIALLILVGCGSERSDSRSNPAPNNSLAWDEAFWDQSDWQ